VRCSLLTGFRSAIRNRKSAIELAEGVGFEPTRACALPVFKTGAINHSTTPPRFSFEKCAIDNSLGKLRAVGGRIISSKCSRRSLVAAEFHSQYCGYKKCLDSELCSVEHKQ
jgi:hypothetical protein